MHMQGAILYNTYPVLSYTRPEAERLLQWVSTHLHVGVACLPY